MADAVLNARGIVILNEGDAVDKIRIPVLGNLSVAIGDQIHLGTDGIGVLMSATATDNDDYVGVAVTGQDGTDGSGETNYVTVATRCLCRVTFATALANTVYAGVGVAISAISSHVWTYAEASSGAGLIGWLLENGDGTRTDLLVKFDSWQVAGSGDGTVGQGLWHAAAIA